MDADKKYFMDRLNLARAMKQTSEFPDLSGSGEADWNIGLEVVGLYIAHNTVTKMVHDGKLDIKSGIYLNATLATNAFCCLHACTHGAVAMGNPDHESFEAMVFRTASLLAFFNDGYLESHKMHHSRCNHPILDTDYGLAHSSITDLGFSMAVSSQVEYKSLARTLKGDPGHFFSWDAQVVPMLFTESIKMMRSSPKYEKMGNTALHTVRESAAVSAMILSLFFGRYPHRGGVNGQDNEVDSYFDTTFRGQSEVDLWMMGEGWHQGHHAKNDVNYTRLPRVALETERDHPELKVRFRGTRDLRTMEIAEGGGKESLELPPHMEADDGPPDQGPYERTARVRAALQRLFSDPEAALEEAALAVVDNALRVACAADLGLLRHIHAQMQIPTDGLELAGQTHEDIYGQELGVGTWAETIFSEANQQSLVASATRIRAEVGKMGHLAGAKSAPRVDRRAPASAFGHSFLAFLRGVADAFCGEAEQERFAAAMAKHLRIPPEARHAHGSTERMWEALHAFLRQPLPRQITLSGRKARDVGHPLSAVKTLASFFSDGFEPTEVPEPGTKFDKFVMNAHFMMMHAEKTEEEEQNSAASLAADARSKL